MIIIIILLLFSNGSFSEGKKSTEFQLLRHLSSHKCKPSDTIGTIKARNDLACAYQCFKHPECVSFFYSNITMVCDRCNTTYDVSDYVISGVEGRSMYYSTKVEDVVEDTTIAEDTTFAEDTTAAKDTTVMDDVVDKKFEYVGCYSAFCDSYSSSGFYPCEAKQKKSIYDGITLDKCNEICKDFSTKFAIWLLDCLCDMFYEKPALETSPCDNNCTGNFEQECGGSGSASIYWIK